MSAARAIVDALVHEGVTWAFGQVGSHMLALYDALADEPRIRNVSCKHECGAATMADVHARLTGNPGVVLTTAGPGATNALTGIARAYQAASPVIHLSATVATHASPESFHGVDRRDFLARMFRDVCKWSVGVRSSEELLPVLSKAFAMARSGRPGPVHVSIPVDVLEGSCAGVYRRTEIERRAPDVTRILRRIAKSRRPVIWAGKDVRACRAQEELAALAEALQAPVVMADAATGAIADTHPLSTGQASLFTQTAEQKALLREADLVLAVGERAASVHGRGLAGVVGRRKVCGVSVDELRRLSERRPLAGRSADILSAFCRPEAGEPAGQRPALRVAALRVAALWALRAFVDDSFLCIGDVGEHNQWARLVLETRNATTYVPEGFWGAMGFAVPGAIAAKMIMPEKRVIGVTGDGCFLSASQELATAIEQRSNPVILVLNDAQYGMVATMQRERYGRTAGTDLHPPDFVALARAFGADGVRVGREEEVEGALARGFASEVPFVIEVCTAERRR